MSKCYCAIDPGAKGYISLQCDGVFEFYSIADNDLHQLSDIFKDIRKRYDSIVCVLEQIHALYDSSASATFSFGEIFGQLQALLIAHGIPYVLVQPKIWQGECWNNADMVVTYEKVKVRGKEIQKKKVNTKATSINAAKRLFPMIDFRRTERCSKVDDNKCDATLMSEYARRKNL